MPVSRDRLSRPVDLSTLLPNAQRRVNLIVDEPGLRLRGVSSQNVSAGKFSSSASAGRLGRRGIQAHRLRLRHHYRYLNRLPVDQENRTPATVRSVQGRRNHLPSWYPRTPLRDITAIVRAIERRRAELQDQREEASQREANAALSEIQDENETNMLTPVPSMAAKNVGCVSEEKANDSDFVTPQKKLLNSIDKVRQVWLEERQRLERTPAAKRAERARKVRTLMSMR